MPKRGHRKQHEICPKTGHRTDVYRDSEGKPRCMAKLKNPKPDGPKRCQAHPVRGMMRCRVHGGMTPKGIQSASWKTGERSTWRHALGIKTRDERDDSYLDLREGIEAQKAILDRYAQRVVEADSPAFREHMAEKVEAIYEALRAADMAALGDAIGKARSYVHKARDEKGALRELSRIAEALSRQVRGAHQARAAAGSMTKDDARSFVSIVVGIVLEEVGKDVAARVLTRVYAEALGGSPPTGMARGGGGSAPRTLAIERPSEVAR